MDYSIFFAGIGTIAIFSFLIKENILYRFFEHLFIGVAAGYLPILTVKNFLWPKIFSPIIGANTILYPDGTVFKNPYDTSILLYLLPIFIGLLFYTAYSKRFSWTSKIAIGVTLGYSAGLSVKGFFAEMIPQVVSSFKPLVVFAKDGTVDFLSSFNNQVFVVTLLLVLYYFFFTFSFESKKASEGRTVARWLLMICFGAFFGSTVMARMALLVERLNFLLDDWWKNFN